jgi:hypothetical protein
MAIGAAFILTAGRTISVSAARGREVAVDGQPPGCQTGGAYCHLWGLLTTGAPLIAIEGDSCDRRGA